MNLYKEETEDIALPQIQPVAKTCIQKDGMRARRGVAILARKRVPCADYRVRNPQLTLPLNNCAVADHVNEGHSRETEITGEFSPPSAQPPHDPIGRLTKQRTTACRGGTSAGRLSMEDFTI